MKGLYIHIPFCKSKCRYCDFTSFSGCDGIFGEYINMLLKEMEQYRGESIDTIFIGGGTPSILPMELFSEIVKGIYSNFDVSESIEFTVEANPKTLSKEKLEKMLNSGVNRLSIGVQSFNDNELAAIGRIHTAYQAEETIKMAKNAGFSNINIDIMFSLPEQTNQSFKNTIEKAIDLDVEHISCYSLILEEGTPLYKDYIEGRLALPDEEEDRANYEYICNELKKAGFLQYEISNFAKSGYECRHNLKYWDCKEYIGLGLSAHSYNGDFRYFNTSSMEKYLNGEYLEEKEERLNCEEKIKEFIIMGFRKTKGIDKQEFFKRFGEDFCLLYKEQITRFVKGGFLEDNGNYIRLTKKGVNVSNSILCEFV